MPILYNTASVNMHLPPVLSSLKVAGFGYQLRQVCVCS